MVLMLAALIAVDTETTGGKDIRETVLTNAAAPPTFEAFPRLESPDAGTLEDKPSEPTDTTPTENIIKPVAVVAQEQPEQQQPEQLHLQQQQPEQQLDLPQQQEQDRAATQSEDVRYVSLSQ